MSVNPNDPRVIRTRQLLRDAMIALILQKGYEAVNIKDITAHAGIRRATFYLHYPDKDDLMRSMLNEMIIDWMRTVGPNALDSLSLESLYAVYHALFQHALNNVDVYRAILSGQGMALVTREWRDYVAGKLRARFVGRTGQYSLKMPIDVLAQYVAAQMVTMLTWWLEQGIPYTPDQMATMCSQLAVYGTMGVTES